jgi:hypothetical protein
MIEPMPGDRVLVCRAAATAYVLAVLERDGPAVITLPETTRIEGGTLALAASELEVTGRLAEIRAARLDVRGAVCRLDFSFLTMKARQLVRLAGSFLGRSKAHREEAEHAVRISAPDVLLEASDTLRARAGTVDVKAEGAAKLDGATVQLG